MKLPHATKARVDRRKIVSYLLSPAHPDGASKAKFFGSFGYRPDRWKRFASALKRHGVRGEVTSSVESKFGTRYSVDGWLEAPDGRWARVRTVWILTRRSKAPRLVTAYPIQE